MKLHLQQTSVAFVVLVTLAGGELARSQGTAGPKAKEPVWTREKVIAEINQLPASLRPPLLAIARSKDQKRLAKLAIDDPDGMHRLTAVRVLTDEKLLAKVAGESKDQFVRVAAVKQLTGKDQPSLLKLIETTKDVQVRGTAIHLVKDPELRAKLNPGAAAFASRQAEEEAQKILKSKAGDRLQFIRFAVTPSVLLQCAMEESDQQLADEAAKRLIELRQFGKADIDDATFEKIALGAKSLYPRRTAIQVVSQATLAKAAEDPDDEIRSAAAARIENPALLAKLARDPQANVRSATIDRLTDRKILQDLASSDPESYVRKHAERRLAALKGKKK